MITKVIICVGYRHVEDDPFPKLLEVFVWFCSILDDEVCQFQIGTAVRRRSSVDFVKHCHRRGKVNSPSSVSIESLDEECASQWREGFHARFRNIDITQACQIMNDLFPCTDIHIIMSRWELGDPQCAINVLNRRFRPCSAQRRTWLQKLADPFIAERVLIFLILSRCLFQGSKCCPRWHNF